MAAMLSIVVFFFSLPYMPLSDSFTSFSKIQMPPGVIGPDSAGFDAFGRGPYVSVGDGRILKWLGPIFGFVDFAYTSPKRTKQMCDGTTDPEMGPICGRPLGLSFYYKTGHLYIGDAYFGLLVVGPNGGLATRLATSAEGVPFKFINGVDVDLNNGTVYFADASTTFELRNSTQPNFKPDSTGRFMNYDPFTKQVTVLLRGLFGTGGPAVSTDSSFVLACELNAKRIYKYWLTGVKANTAEVFINFPGNPIKIKRATTTGEFWVAVNEINQQQLTLPQGYRINAYGRMEIVSFAAQYNNRSISVVQEQNGALYVGSRVVDFVGVFKN
ncbi:protein STRICTOSIDINE SYNTHASE-LIKE 10-like [Cornus florida]|uniref:protein STRICTOSIDINE SYNTHASE-LIKE 10-like n=1 Tax=Cornus florida TaxID=4283 RepID=UPI002897B19D|nr:protein STRICTOSIDINE SYNTHASE-LIKE 10-like [Cornus florida]